MVALHLFGDIAQGIGSAFTVKFIDRHKLGKVQHVDFFELAGCTELGGHDVHGYIHVRHDGGVALANAGGLHHNQVKARHLAGSHHIGQSRRNFRPKVTCGQAAHENTLTVLPRIDGVHADPVAQQSATTFAP